MNFKLKKLTKKTIPLIIIFFAIILSVITITFGSNIIESLTTNINYKESLSAERQANYDKMKIDYVNIKNRVTGTAPWNSGDTSNADGVDVSETDDYVRTFDVMKYTLELGISPNTNSDGVTDASTFTGGVIKVKATLPNQGDLTLMTWEEDAWMQNVSYNDDKTEIYAEYHVPSGVSITNANQNLSFTIKVGGYKKEVTSDMAPTFEVWMEGNQPDDDSSYISSVEVTDTRNTIISGHPSYNISIAQGSYLNLSDKKEVNGETLNGQYINYGVALSLYQDVSGFSDLRGVEYPTDTFSLKLKMNYKYFNEDTNSGWITIDENTTNAINLVNGTEVIAYGLNLEYKDGYYPVSTYTYGTDAFPSGSKKIWGKGQVEDSGTMTLTQDEEYITITFDDYVLNGTFPTYTSTATYANIPSTTGYFAASNFELFIPYYDDGNASYLYQLHFDIVDATYSTLTQKNITPEKDSNGRIIDAYQTDNTKASSLINYLTGGAWAIARSYDKNYSTYLDNYYYYGNGSILQGEEFIMLATMRMTNGPYEGGSDGLFSWNAKFFKIKDYNSTSKIGCNSSSVIGLPTYSHENNKFYYGIYKDNPEEGLTTNELTNAAVYDDFTWYETYEEASANGLVTSVYIDDPDNLGNLISRNYMFRFEALQNNDNIGKIGIFRYKTKFYADKERTKVYYYGGESRYNSATGYTPTKYAEDGSIISYEASEQYGETILILGVQSSTNITVTDLDSSGSAKKAYDVGDGEINFKVTPKLSNGKAASDEDSYLNDIKITNILPSGLSYKLGSANKEPSSVTINQDGTTTIVWEYDNWQINHAAPDYENITYTAEISASLENNQSLNVKSIIYVKEDLREESQYRTSNYGVVISNLAGSKAVKEIDKSIVEANESFVVTSSIGNTSQESLKNVKSLEILPTNGDSNGTVFSGSYTSKIIELAENQKLYYTNDNINSIGITEDKYGKLTIKDVDLTTDSRWIEASVGETIPSTATAIATLIDTISPSSEISYKLEFIPSNNKAGNKYAFTMNVTSDNLQAAVKTNTVIAQVAERNISGIAFIDVNRNNIYDSGDTLLSNNVVKLLDSTGNIVSSTQTDSDGKYSFECVDKGDYYIEFSIPTNYEVISKNGGEDSNSNIANSNGKTDVLSGQNQTPTQEVVNLENINLGIRKISSSLVVKYLENGTNSVLAPQEESTVYYGDTYTTKSSTEIPSNYELLKKTDNYTGIVSSKTIEVIYYYQKKDSSLETSISKDGPESITTKDEVVKYEIKYNAKVVDYIGNGTITIVDTLPYAIDEEKSSLDGGTYNADDKTITWIEEWTDIDTYNNKDNKEITKSIELVFEGIEGTDRVMVNSISGNVKLDNNERDTESQTSTDIKIPGKIITHHYIKGTTDKLKDDVESTDLVGESFTSSALDIDGYIITKPETEEYVFTEEDQEIIYEYERIKLKVETVVNGIGGTIVGNEDVLYGDNSTKDFIIIKPDEGYVLGSVMINGVEVELSEEEKKQLILNNFENMTEDMIIQVTFVKETVPNPETGSFATFAKLLFAISLLILFYLYKNKHKNKVYNLD